MEKYNLQLPHVRFKDFPFTHALAIAYMFNMASQVIYFWPIDTLAFATIALSIFVACVCVLAGLQWRGSVYIASALERVGHGILVGYWLMIVTLEIGFVLGFAFTLPTLTLYGFIVPLVLALAHALRMYKLGKTMKGIRTVLHEAAQEAGDNN